MTMEDSGGSGAFPSVDHQVVIVAFIGFVKLLQTPERKTNEDQKHRAPKNDLRQVNTKI